MSKLDEIEKRIERIEGMLDAVVVVLNKLIDDFYDPRFVRKLDKLAEYGKRSEDGAADGDTVC